MAILHATSPDGTQKDIDLDKIVLKNDSGHVIERAFLIDGYTHAIIHGGGDDSESANGLVLMSDTSTFDKPCIMLDNATGMFYITAGDGTTKVRLEGLNDGTLKWNNKNIAVDIKTGSTNGTISVNDSDVAVKGLASGAYATAYVHPTGSGNNHIPSGGSSGQILRWSANGTAAWGADSDTTYSAMSATEAKTGTATTARSITAAVLKTAIAAHTASEKSIAANGYLHLSSGLIIQWGKLNTDAGGSSSITFPIAFSTCYSIVCSYNVNAEGSSYEYALKVKSYTTSKFTVYHDAPDLFWIAIGK